MNRLRASVDFTNGKPRLLEQVRETIRVRHYSPRTEDAYVGWIKRYIFFHDTRHPAELGRAEIEQFLSHLAVQRKVSASTQNQAFSALLFLYQEVLDIRLDKIDALRAKRPKRLPLILTPQGLFPEITFRSLSASPPTWLYCAPPVI